MPAIRSKHDQLRVTRSAHAHKTSRFTAALTAVNEDDLVIESGVWRISTADCPWGRSPLATRQAHRLQITPRSSFLLPRKETVMYLKIIAAALAVAFLAGCNTMEGAGKDIKQGGESIENSAKKQKDSN